MPERPELETSRREISEVILDGLKRNMSRGNSLSDEFDLSSVLGDTELICIVPFGGSYSEPKGNSS